MLKATDKECLLQILSAHISVIICAMRQIAHVCNCGKFTFLNMPRRPCMTLSFQECSTYPEVSTTPYWCIYIWRDFSMKISSSFVDSLFWKATQRKSMVLVEANFACPKPIRLHFHRYFSGVGQSQRLLHYYVEAVSDIFQTQFQDQASLCLKDICARATQKQYKSLGYFCDPGKNCLVLHHCFRPRAIDTLP